MIQDQKKYINNKNKILPAIGLDPDRFSELRGILSDHFILRDIDSVDKTIEFLSGTFNGIIAVVFDASLIYTENFDLLERMDKDKRFVEIPVIAASDSCSSDICK